MLENGDELVLVSFGWTELAVDVVLEDCILERMLELSSCTATF